jgi:hypothetical protein
MSEFLKLPWYVTFFIFATCWPAAVFSEPTLRFTPEDDTYIALFDRPCTEPVVLKWLKVEWHSKYKASEVVMDGKPQRMCWTPFPEEKIIYAVWEDGSHGPLPMKAFKPDLGV